MEEGTMVESKDVKIVYSKFEDIESEQINEGYYRRTVTGENHMTCLVNIRPGWITKHHKHASDETVIVMEGSMSFRVGNLDVELLPGDVLYIPPWVEHGGTVGQKGMKMIKIFSPPREDYLQGTDTYLRESQTVAEKPL
jgi:quercetin dioxygenase-like cupin family protein